MVRLGAEKTHKHDNGDMEVAVPLPSIPGPPERKGYTEQQEDKGQDNDLRPAATTLEKGDLRAQLRKDQVFLPICL